MQQILGYNISAKLYESDNTFVFRANGKEADSVILKVLKSQSPGSEEILRFYQEYELMHSLNSIPGVIDTFGLENDDDSLVMILEDFGASSLDRLMNENLFSLEQVLYISIQIVKILGEIHQASIIHKNINPANIVMNLYEMKVKLIDFGIASVIGNKGNRILFPSTIEGTLSYISPEQTGRIDCTVDHRADFYSLGATIYELIAHKPPFSTTDHMDLIHSHLAKNPVPLNIIQSNIPDSVADIVIKLMSKDPQERYATAQGILEDLQKCLDLLKKGERVFSFPLAMGDIGNGLKIEEKLFGRETELELLQRTFRQTLTGTKQIVFITGPAGIGKTCLVKKIEQNTVLNKGIFISGKFNQLSQSIPYSGIIQAFRRLGRYLLTRSDQELKKWQKDLSEYLGNQGFEIIDLIPDFKKILGNRPKVTGLKGLQVKNRFYLMVENLLSVFGRKQTPFVIFLDDLQWADQSSLGLIKEVMLSPVIESIMVICAYRDNEFPQGNALQEMVDQLKKEEIGFYFIDLASLSVPAITEMIAECLQCQVEKISELSRWIHAVSHGNPFHAIELVTSLYAQRKLFFDIQKRIWSWKLEDTQSLRMPDGIIELLSRKMQILPSPLLNILILAACIGYTFELDILIIVSEQPHDNILKALEKLIAAGFILPMNDEFRSASTTESDNSAIFYKFTHDRIHHAAYNFIPRDKRERNHWQIGLLALRKLSEVQIEKRLFEIVNQLNKGRDLLQYGPEKKELAAYNLKAAQKAKVSAAFNQAYTYFRIGINLLVSADTSENAEKKYQTNHWLDSYDLISTLYLGAIEMAYLTAQFQHVDQLGEIFLANATRLQDQLMFYNIKIQSCYALNRMEEAANTSLHSLALFGIRVPKKITKKKIVSEYIKTRLLLWGKSMDSLSRMPIAKNPEKRIILNILRNAMLPLYFVNAKLFPIIVFKGIRIAVRYGGTIDTAYAFAGYGMILSGVLNQFEKGYEFGRLAIKMMERFDTNDLSAKILVTVSTFTTHWKEHLKNVIPMLEKACEKGIESGDFEFTAIAWFKDSSFRFFLGENLLDLKRKGELNKAKINRLQQKTMELYQGMHLQAITNLIEPSNIPCSLIGQYYDEREMLPAHLSANDAGALFNFYFLKIILCLFFGHFKESSENIAVAEKYLFSQSVATEDVQFCFYSSLCILLNLDPSQPETKKIIRVKKMQKKMKKWAKNSPMNYEHKFCLVEAEIRRIDNKPREAEVYYNRAIMKAKENGFLHDEALSNELSGRFYFSQNDFSKGNDKIKQAWHNYYRWGANAKLLQLETLYPEIFQPKSKPARPDLTTLDKTVIRASGEILDWNAILKASIAISSEIYIEQLNEKLMQIVIKITGAQKGVLFLWEKNELNAVSVYPTMFFQKNELGHINFENCSEVPKSIVRYTERLKEGILSNSGQHDPLFDQDPYIIENNPKSLLCFPLLYKAKLMGIIYLENNLVSGTFTSHSLESLKILSAQISVSLENARLYRDLNEQTDQLKSVNIKLRNEVEERSRMEVELKKYRDQLKKELDIQTIELKKKTQTIESIELEANRRHRFLNIIGKSDQMQKIYELIETLSDVNANVLIIGESGTGKELVAQAIHHSGNRKDLPFIRVNCAALSESLLESELFGHVKGAFTGAEKNKMGRFQKAGNGSILLDEIGDVTMHFQKRLLRVLQEREFEPLGDTKIIQMNARVMASTNKNLLEKVENKTFREDLYYRLKVIEIKIPPLRERKEDIPLLINHFLSEFNAGMLKNITRVSEDAYQILLSYHWPGNVRELKNIMEYAVVTCKGSIITTENLPEDFNSVSSAPYFKSLLSKDLDDREVILQGLENAKWNKTKAAKLMGIGRRTLYRKLKQHSIE